MQLQGILLCSKGFSFAAARVPALQLQGILLCSKEGFQLCSCKGSCFAARQGFQLCSCKGSCFAARQGFQLCSCKGSCFAAGKGFSFAAARDPALQQGRVSALQLQGFLLCRKEGFKLCSRPVVPENRAESFNQKCWKKQTIDNKMCKLHQDSHLVVALLPFQQSPSDT